MISARSSIDPAGTPYARRSVSAIVAVASVTVLLAASTACGASESSGLGGVAASNPNATAPAPGPASSGNPLVGPGPSGPEGSPSIAPAPASSGNPLVGLGPSEPEASASPTASPTQIAQWIGYLVEGKEQLGPLAGSDGQAISANCDPSTVSIPDASTITASCEITYADGSVRQQTVTVTLDSQGNPVAASANAGTEVSPPTGGSSSGLPT
jgi:hypothetical protein